MISLEHVTKRYGDRMAVDDLSIEIDDGDVAVLIGPSGCGKTTTLRMINRLIEPTSGRILIDGTDAATLKPEELRQHIGYAIQSVGLFPHLTVAENIATVPKLLGWKTARIVSRCEELLALVGLDPAQYSRKYPRQLSGGEAQRVGVARALAADPPILLMDEPFGAVDPLNRDRLQGEFLRIQRDLKKTVVFVTHDVDEAIRLADKIALMRDGHLEQYDSPEQLLDHPETKFVHDFVGADAALKRLGRVRVDSVMRTGQATVRADQPDAIEAACASESRFVYLVDADGVLVGWIDSRVLDRGTPAAEAATRVDWRQAAVRPDGSLKEALARMLALGYRSLPVVAAGGRLLGHVTLSDVEKTMEGGDAHLADHTDNEAGSIGGGGE
ncbi:MAG: glycine betaine ABC transporter ATP-binding protein [Actinobacteria bacterium HGW-Actinobacteria-7]|nr:MAG: glycine betaine ABC transporter ATP-binding protein [Actinobacteria bacterium HGW-Actinobacteria-7]